MEVTNWFRKIFLYTFMLPLKKHGRVDQDNCLSFYIMKILPSHWRHPTLAWMYRPRHAIAFPFMYVIILPLSTSANITVALFSILANTVPLQIKVFTLIYQRMPYRVYFPFCITPQYIYRRAIRLEQLMFLRSSLSFLNQFSYFLIFFNTYTKTYFM